MSFSVLLTSPTVFLFFSCICDVFRELAFPWCSEIILKSCPMFLDHWTTYLSLILHMPSSAIGELLSPPSATCTFVFPTQHCSCHSSSDRPVFSQSTAVRAFSASFGLWDTVLVHGLCWGPLQPFTAQRENQRLLLSQTPLKYSSSILNAAAHPNLTFSLPSLNLCRAPFKPSVFFLVS